MSADRLYHEMNLKGYQAEDTWMGKGGDLFVLVSVPRESLDCRQCGCHRVHVHEWRQRFWKGAPLGLTPVIVTLKTPRVKCLDCGSRTAVAISDSIPDGLLVSIARDRLGLGSRYTAGTEQNPATSPATEGAEAGRTE